MLLKQLPVAKGEHPRLIGLVTGLCGLVLSGCISAIDKTDPGSDLAEKGYETVQLSLPDSNSISAFETQVHAALADNVAPGFVFVVVDKNEVVLSKGFGYADLENKVAVTPETIFPLGSVSKTFIGSAAAIAHHQGRIDLEAPISHYLSFEIDDPRAGKEISFLHLATHSSGVIDSDPAYETAYAFDSEVHPSNLKAFLESYLTQGGLLYDPDMNFHDYAPGLRYDYSNIASALAALTLSDAVGAPFEDFTRDEVFAPLGMSSTVWFLPEADKSRIGKLYQREQGSFSPYPSYALATWPDGGLRTSARDLTRYLMAFMSSGRLDDTQVIDAEAVDLALGGVDVSQVGNLPEKDVSAALFWGMSKAPDALQARPLIGHNGVDPGIWTLMQFDPVTERGVIAIANADMDSREHVIAFYSLAYRLFLTDFTE